MIGGHTVAQVVEERDARVDVLVPTLDASDVAALFLGREDLDEVHFGVDLVPPRVRADFV